MDRPLTDDRWGQSTCFVLFGYSVRLWSLGVPSNRPCVAFGAFKK